MAYMAAEPRRGASPCPADDPLSAKTTRSSRTRRGLASRTNSAGRLPLRRDVNPAAIGGSLAETAETPHWLPAVAGVPPPTLIGGSLAEIAEILSKAPGGDQRFAPRGFAGRA